MLENTEGKKKGAIERNWQHRVHKTQDKQMLENSEGAIKMNKPEKLAT